MPKRQASEEQGVASMDFGHTEEEQKKREEEIEEKIKDPKQYLESFEQVRDTF